MPGSLGVHRHGFPLDHPEDTAIDTAVEEAKHLHADGWTEVRHEVIRSPEAEANGEYIVRVTFD